MRSCTGLSKAFEVHLAIKGQEFKAVPGLKFEGRKMVVVGGKVRACSNPGMCFICPLQSNVRPWYIEPWSCSFFHGR